MKKFDFKRAIQFICLCGASIIYYVPYMKASFYDALINFQQESCWLFHMWLQGCCA